MKEWLGLLARLVTGGVWIVAGAVKLPDPAQSVAAVRAYQLLPTSLVTPVGQLLPVIEIVVGVCLVLGILTRGAAVVSALLFVAFIIGISSAWARGLEINCGCFGNGGVPANPQRQYAIDIARDVGLLLCSVWLVIWPRTKFALDNLLFRRTSTSEGI